MPSATGSLYDLPDGIVFSIPVRFTETGYWEAVDDVTLSANQKEQLQLAVQVKIEAAAGNTSQNMVDGNPD